MKVRLFITFIMMIYDYAFNNNGFCFECSGQDTILRSWRFLCSRCFLFVGKKEHRKFWWNYWDCVLFKDFIKASLVIFFSIWNLLHKFYIILTNFESPMAALRPRRTEAFTKAASWGVSVPSFNVYWAQRVLAWTAYEKRFSIGLERFEHGDTYYSKRQMWLPNLGLRGLSLVSDFSLHWVAEFKFLSLFDNHLPQSVKWVSFKALKVGWRIKWYPIICRMEKTWS